MDKSFDFKSQSGLRLRTIHSSKGLDFPVVLLYLPREPFASRHFSDEVMRKIARNLIYVAMTRAMEYLNILIIDDSSSEAIQALAELSK